MAWTGNTHSISLVAASSQYLSHVDDNLFDITGNITFECWLKFTSLPTDGNNMCIASKFLSTGNQQSYAFVINNTGGVYTLKLRFMIF